MKKCGTRPSLKGDWNGDGEFDSRDLVSAFQAGSYSTFVQAIGFEPNLFVNQSLNARQRRVAQSNG